MRSLWNKRRLDGLEEEIREHIERETEDNIERGMTPEEARQGMVVRQGMAFDMAGIVAGLVAALGLTRLMASLLYDVKPNDPWTFAVAAATLGAAALLASWVPALKAALIDPLKALRYE